LEPAVALQVTAHLLDLDPGRFLNREPTHARAERDQPKRPRPERVRLLQGARGGAANDLRGGRPAKLHRRGVDDPSTRHLAALSLNGFAETDGGALTAFALDLPAARARDRDGHAPAVDQPRVRSIGDRVDLKLGDVHF